jgi:hypothetical protein
MSRRFRHRASLFSNTKAGVKICTSACVCWCIRLPTDAVFLHPSTARICPHRFFKVNAAARWAKAGQADGFLCIPHSPCRDPLPHTSPEIFVLFPRLAVRSSILLPAEPQSPSAVLYPRRQPPPAHPPLIAPSLPTIAVNEDPPPTPSPSA